MQGQELDRTVKSPSRLRSYWSVIRHPGKIRLGKVENIYDPLADFETVTLSNGLTIHHLYQNKPYLSVQIVIHAGSREDARGREGLAHFVEHLVSRNSKEFPDYIENKKFFTSTGGSVSFGCTGVLDTDYEFFIPTHPRTVEKAFALFGSMLIGARIENAVEEQRKVILEEYSRKFPDDKMLYLSRLPYEYTLGTDHRLTHSTGLGRPETVSAITAADAQKFYDEYYVPQNMEIVVSGGVKMRELRGMIEKTHFADVLPGKRNPIPERFVPEMPTEHFIEKSISKYFSIKSRQTTYQRITILSGRNPYPASLLAGTLSHILFEEIREKRSLAYGFGAGMHNLQSFLVFSIYGEVAADKAKVVDEIVLDVLKDTERLKKVFEEVKDRRLKSILLYDPSVETFVEHAAEDIGLEQRIVPNRESYALLSAVTWADAESVLKEIAPERSLVYFETP